jgi:spermidine synthase
MKSQPASPPSRPPAPVLFLFLLSGFAGLLYEIVWMKLLILVIGNTIYSVTAVLAAFMGGLALGSMLAGRFSNRSMRPLRLYGQLEILIGLLGLAVLLLIGAAEPVFQFIDRQFVLGPAGMTLIRFAICCAVLLLPATVMGATLPILSRYASSGSATGWTVANLYGLNSLGAALGSLAAAFLLIPALGLTRTTWIAVLMNLAVGAAALLLEQHGTAPSADRRSKPRQAKAPAPTAELPQLSKRAAATIATALGLSGLAGMMYQVAWTRTLTLVLGSSVYVFGLIVSAFIGGLALGSLAIGPLTRRKHLLLSLALVQLGIAVAAFCLIPLLGRLTPLVATQFAEPGRSFAGLQAIEFSLVFALMLVPTALMGAALPLAVAASARAVAQISEQVGRLYAANTLGAIVGVLVSGLLLIPLAGTERTLLIAVAVNVIAATAVLATSTSPRRSYRRALIAAGCGFAGLVWLLPPWNPLLLTAGPYLYSDRYAEIAAQKGIPLAEAMVEGRQLLFFKEGLHAAVSVTRSAEGDVTLGINGKTDATARADASTQLLVGHLPLLLKPGAKDVLLIGMGSGMTLAAVERHPVKSVDVVEIEPAVIEASRQFDWFTGAPLNDSRSHLTLADGRQYLSHSERRYDVVISEPSNPWISGMANLFTREFFESARTHLAADGVMCQWVQSYSMSPEDFKTVLRTFAEVFPQATLWEADLGNDYLLIGSAAELRLDLDALRATLAERRLRSDLTISNTLEVPSLVARLVLDAEGVRHFAAGAPIHTDDNARLEYSAPRSLVAGRSSQLINQLYAARTQPWAQLAALGWTSPPQEIANPVEAAFSAKQEIIAGYAAMSESALDEARVHLERAHSLQPQSHDAAYLLARLYNETGSRAMTAQDSRAAQQAYRKSVSSVDDFLGADTARLRSHFLLAAAYAQANIQLGNLLLAGNQLEAAAAAFRRSFLGGIRYPEAHTNLGVVLERMGQLDSAGREYHQALEAAPKHLSARMNLGSLWLRTGRTREAVAQYREVLRIHPENAIAHFNLGAAYFQQRAWKDADREWRWALRLQPDFDQARRSLDIVGDSLRSR